MPWRSEYYPVPITPGLPVLTEAEATALAAGGPGGVRIWGLGFGQPKEIRGNGVSYYECRHCGGFVPRHPHKSRVDTLVPLSGRRGIEWYCVRCGNKLRFMGMMS